MTRNLPVPDGPRAPLSLRWLWWVGPPALITWLYRTLLPPRLRRLWGMKSHHSTSHLALGLILAGFGWRAFWRFAVPGTAKDWVPWGPEGDSGWWTGGPFWMLPAWVSPHMGPQLGWEEDYGRGGRVRELPDWFPTT